MNTKRNKIKKGDTMIYEEKRFMAVSEIEKECCTGCCFYDNGNCQLENPITFLASANACFSFSDANNASNASI